MNSNVRNVSILKKIIGYCNDINEAIAAYGNEYKIFVATKFYRYTVSLCVLQIGELVGKLTDSFTKAHPSIPWQSIKDMRNIVAHEYERFDYEILWATMQEDIPMLREYCQKALGQLQRVESQHK